MGTPKALLPWGDTTLLGHALNTVRSSRVDDVVVVVGPATRHLSLDVVTVFNPSPESGRSTSIRLGCGALPEDVEAVLIQSVDQPTTSEVLNALYAAITPTTDVAVPTFNGQRGHPVCLAGRLLNELRTVSEQDQGLRAIVRRHLVSEVPVYSESVVWNLNDPATYDEARART
jgi:molybdenum cofactor cytidylyltransferase